MPAPITLPPLDEQLQAELRQRYEDATQEARLSLAKAEQWRYNHEYITN